MRNLTIIGRETLRLPESTAEASSSTRRWVPSTYGQCDIQAITINPASNEVYVAALESSDAGNKQGLATVWIWHQLPTGCYIVDASEAELTPAFAPVRIQLASTPVPFSKQGEASTSRLPPRSSMLQPGLAPEEIVLLQYLNDGGSLCENEPALALVTAGGDILVGKIPSREDMMQSEDVNGSASIPRLNFEVVGSIEQGIYAAQFSPDEEFLVIVTAPTWLEDEQRWEGEKVLFMTKEFEVLSERALATDEFGEDKPVDVGWGSKATQFHGSEGKSAAEAAAELAAQQKTSEGKKRDTRGPHVSDDDGRPRISWKADSSFFAISALEFSPIANDVPTSADHDPLRWNRILRVFTRMGALSSTSEADVRGMSQALAYKPMGNIIATTQRFGKWETQSADQKAAIQWAAGRNGRHDVIFFERNGLRHGGFGLREDSGAQPIGIEFTEEADAAHELAAKPWQNKHVVRDLAWNIDGTALAVVIQRSGGGNSTAQQTFVQLWTTGNYHWYLKQEIPIDGLAGLASATVRWHPESPFELYVAERQCVRHVTLSYETATTLDPLPVDAACVAVADGDATLLTPFRLQNVPPPMSTMALLSSRRKREGLQATVPTHFAWASVPPPSTAPQHSAHILAILYSDANIDLVLFDWGVFGRKAPVGGRPVATPRRLVAGLQLPEIPKRAMPFQIAVSSRRDGEALAAEVAVLGISDDNTVCCATLAWSSGKSTTQNVPIPTESVSRARLIGRPAGQNGFLIETEASIDGRSSFMTLQNGDLHAIPSLIPSFCTDLKVLRWDPLLVIALGANGRLHANKRLLATGVNSFIITGSFLVWTNNAHQARFLPIQSLLEPQKAESGESQQGEPITLSRAVERGSRIVTAVASEMSLVLQMPRGNLETINPRPMVLEVVRRDLDKKRFRSALRVCRAHRLDMNLLHDHNPAEFMSNLGLFVKQIGDVDHLNLFLAGLKDEDVTKTLYRVYGAQDTPDTHEFEGKTNSICTALRAELERTEPKKYLQSILTSYVKQSPPDYEGALSLLKTLKDEDADATAEAVKYLVFLADAERLYDVALGMYDFELTLMLAQHASRKDPREYLPFLREIRGIENVSLQRFRIDDHLSRHAKAFRWLAQAGEGHVKASLEYMSKHELYEEGFAAFASDPTRLRMVYDAYGDWMLSRSKSSDAAAAYVMAAQPKKAVEAYTTAGQWQEALTVGINSRLPAMELAELAKRIVLDLEASSQFAEAAQVALNHLRDVESAVGFLCRANDISQAKRICAVSGRADLIETHVKPQSLETQTTILDTIGEMREQLDKQVARLCELLSKEELGTDAMNIGGGDGGDVGDIDVLSDTSTQITQFTRYTAALSAHTSASSSHRSRNTAWRASNERRKREQKKKETGKKGSVYEENYLFESLQRLLKERLKGVQSDVERLGHNLLLLATPQHREAAFELQGALLRFEEAALKGTEEIYNKGVERERRVFEKLEQQGNDAARAAAGQGRNADAVEDAADGAAARTADPNMALMQSYLQLAALALEGKVRGRPRLQISEAKWRSSLLGALDPSRAK